MARRGENIYHRKDGRWEGRYIVGHAENGKALYKAVYGHSYKEVKEKKAAALKALAELNYEGQPRAGTVAAVATDWIKSNAHRWKESTKCRYQEKLDTWILPVFGERELSDISTQELEKFIVQIQTEGISGRKALGASAAAMVLTIMRQIRLQALKTDCQVRFSAECISVKQRKKETTVFTEQEVKQIVAILKTDTDETDAAILISFFTGIRVGEVCALKGDNIDLDSGVIHIRNTTQRLPVKNGTGKTTIKVDTPKSERSVRDIPLNKELAEVLRPFVKPGAYLLTGDQKKFVEPRTMENRFNAVLKKCGLKKAGYHSTRRTFASRCIERGMDPKTLSEILGHASVSTTLDLYVRINLKRKADGLDLLSDLFSV